MEFDKNINALFVADNGSDADIIIPECLGKPKEGQMVGTKAEKLSELSGRICYDSLGTPESRSSLKYHKHIQEVGHGSVYEHPPVTVVLQSGDIVSILWALANRPGVVVYPCADIGPAVRISLNYRSLMEWYTWSDPATFMAERIGNLIRDTVRAQAPQIIGQNQVTSFGGTNMYCSMAAPVLQEEKWISMYLSGGRGFSHEMVRHGDRSAISQRSSRFCDENESQWIEHPLITKYFDDTSKSDAHSKLHLNEYRPGLQEHAQSVYRVTVDALQQYLISKGVDKTTARKQARGAARNDLGNGLFTEMIFSASVAQWHRIFKQRGSVFADAEIRRVAALALNEIQTKSAFAADFANIELIPSPDGIGAAMKWK